jgi:hypothetical protein
MHARCSGYNKVLARRYVDRNIRVCPEWTGRGGFEVFFAHMGECPPGMTLDRIDNNQGYKPGNCRWTDHKAQARNRETNVRVNYQGKSMILTDACKAAGIKMPNIYRWIARRGMTPQEAFDYTIAPTAMEQRTAWVFHDGERLSLSAACKAAGIGRPAVSQWARRKGVSHQEAFNRLATRAERSAAS